MLIRVFSINVYVNKTRLRNNVRLEKESSSISRGLITLSGWSVSGWGSSLDSHSVIFKGVRFGERVVLDVIEVLSN